MLKVVIVVVILAVIVYAVVRMLLGNGPGPGRSPAKPPRPLAPDDDPEFLRDLDRRRRQRDDSDS